MSENKIIEKKIARIVKSELDKGNYEDTAWLKAFKEAGGDKNQARAIYVGVRSKDLEDEFYEEQLKFAYGNKLNDTIRLFFLLKFLKIYLYKK